MCGQCKVNINFKSQGTWPERAISIDSATVMVIAGGGGGGADSGAGGGAGGMLLMTSVPLGSGTLPVTIGSGGSPGTTGPGNPPGGAGTPGNNTVFVTAPNAGVLSTNIYRIGGGVGGQPGRSTTRTGGSGGGGYKRWTRDMWRCFYSI